MQYVVIVSTLHVLRNKAGEDKSNTTVQYLNAKNIHHARAVAEVLERGRLFYHAEPAVKIWNGKAFAVIPLCCIEQVYSEMTNPSEMEAAE